MQQLAPSQVQWPALCVKKNSNVWGSVLSECFFCTVFAGETRCDKTTMCNTKAKNALKFCLVMSSHVVLNEASWEKRNSLLSVGMTAALWSQIAFRALIYSSKQIWCLTFVACTFLFPPMSSKQTETETNILSGLSHLFLWPACTLACLHLHRWDSAKFKPRGPIVVGTGCRNVYRLDGKM